MIIKKIGFGNYTEAFVEDRFQDGVNIIFSDENNKGKTLVIQGMMFSLGNEPIFPSGFPAEIYYFYSQVEINGENIDFLRHRNSINVKVIILTFAHIKMYIFNLQKASYGPLTDKTFLKSKLHEHDEGFYLKWHLQQLHHKKYHPMN